MGAIADRYGAGRVIVIGALATALGLYLMSHRPAATAYCLLDAACCSGIGVSGTGMTALVGAVGRAVPEDKRMAAIASLGMAAGIGGFVAFPYAHLAIQTLGWQESLC